MSLPKQAPMAAMAGRGALACGLALLLALHPTFALKAWTWRGGSALVTGSRGVYGPCDRWEQLAWEDCRLQYDADTCAAEGELGLVNCDAFAGVTWPGARTGHAVAVDARDDGVWLFGGAGTSANQAGLLNDLWYLLPKQPGIQTGTWQWYGGRQSPAGRADHAALRVGSMVTWPGARERHTLVVKSDGSLLMFGGEGFAAKGTQRGYLNDLWEFSAGMWRFRGGGVVPDVVGDYGSLHVSSGDAWPGSRAGHSMWRDRWGTVWLFGGQGYPARRAGYGSRIGLLNDVWSFAETGGGVWTWRGGSTRLDSVGQYDSLAGDLVVGARRGASVHYDHESRLLWLYGGEGYAEDLTSFGLLADLWSFDGRFWAFHAGAKQVNQRGTLVSPESCTAVDQFMSLDLELCASPELDGNPATCTSLRQNYAPDRVADVCVHSPATISRPGARKLASIWIDRAPASCINTPNWITYLIYQGVNYGSNTCSDYERNVGAGVCEDFGHYANSAGVTATQACCACGGGTTPDAVSTLKVMGGYGIALSGDRGQLADLWSYDLDFGGGWFIETGPRTVGTTGVYGRVGQGSTSTWPASRSGSATWTDSLGRVWSFGGYGFPSVTGSDPGGMNDLWSYGNLCTIGTTIPNSRTSCSGYVTTEVCPFVCDDGYKKIGEAVCDADGRMAGGYCLMSTCAAPKLTRGQMIVVGCEDGGEIGDTCQVACADGYTVQGGGRGNCRADVGRETASYQGQNVNCVPDKCPSPALRPGEVAIGGSCRHDGYHGCKNGIGPWACRDSADELWSPGVVCELDCADGFIAAREIQEARGTCLAVENRPTASYRGQQAHCVESLIDDIGGWTWHAGASAVDIPGTAAEECSFLEDRARACGASCSSLDCFSTKTVDVAQGSCSAIEPMGAFEECSTAVGLNGESVCVPIGSCRDQVPAARSGHRVWHDATTGKVWMFGGTGAALGFGHKPWYFNDLWYLTPVADVIGGVHTPGQWTRRGGDRIPDARSTSTWPGARTGHAVCMDAAGITWMLGGYGYSDDRALGFLSDMWSWAHDIWTYHGGTLQIGFHGVMTPSDQSNCRNPLDGACGTVGMVLCNDHCVPQMSENIYSATGVPTSDWPAARTSAAAWRDPRDGVWFFGGWGYAPRGPTAAGYLNDLWRWRGELWSWAGGSSQINSNGAYGVDGSFSTSNWPGARITVASQPFVAGTAWMFGGEGYGSTVRPIYTSIRAITGYRIRPATCDGVARAQRTCVGASCVVTIPQCDLAAETDGTADCPAGCRYVPAAENTDNKVAIPFSFCMAPLLTIRVRPTDYDEADEYLKMYVNGHYLGICDPNDGQGCNRQYTCLHEQDISPYVSLEGSIEVHLVNTKDVTVATSSQNTAADRATTCDGEGGVGPYLLAAKVELRGCSTDRSLGMLNDIWAFDGNSWLYHSPVNNTNIASVHVDRGRPSDMAWPGSRSRHAIWSDDLDSGRVWIMGGDSQTDGQDASRLNDMWMFDPTSVQWTWVGDANSTRTNELGKYGTKHLAYPTNWPGARYDAAFWIDGEGVRWMHGGSGWGSCLNFQNGTCWDGLDGPVGEQGALNDLWAFSNWCTGGLRVERSSTLCSGTTGQTCDYVCDDGYSPAGVHRCMPDRSFTGGVCAPATCAAPPIGPGQYVVSGCENDGAIGDECIHGCLEGYVPTEAAAGVCMPDNSSVTAQYYGHFSPTSEGDNFIGVICTPATCSAPPPIVTLENYVVSGCAAGATFEHVRADGSPSRCADPLDARCGTVGMVSCGEDCVPVGRVADQCTLGCRHYSAVEQTTGDCAILDGEPAAEFSGQNVVCKVGSPETLSRAWTWENGDNTVDVRSIYTGETERPGSRSQHAVAAAMFAGVTWGEAADDIASCPTADISDPDVTASRAICEGMGACTYINGWTKTYASPLSGWCLNSDGERPELVQLQNVVGATDCATACSADDVCEGFTIKVGEGNVCALHTTAAHSGGTVYYEGNPIQIAGNDRNTPRSVAQCYIRVKQTEACEAVSMPWVLFGGYGYAANPATTGLLNDLWTWDGLRWDFRGGSTAVDSHGDYTGLVSWPGAREGHSLFTLDEVMLFGGAGFAASGPKGYLNDLWKLSSSLRWTWLGGSSGTDARGLIDGGMPPKWPGSRRGQVAWTIGGDVAYIFGGEGFLRWPSDSCASASPDGLLEECDGGAVCVPRGTCASNHDAGYLNDLWSLQSTSSEGPVTFLWECLGGKLTVDASSLYSSQGQAFGSNWPGGRISSAAWAIGASGWMFGGIGFARDGTLGHLPELWSHDGSSWRWHGGEYASAPSTFGTDGLAAAGNWPAARLGHSLWADSERSLWLAGGSGVAAGTTDKLNDVWQFDTSTTQWTFWAGHRGSDAHGMYGQLNLADRDNWISGRDGASTVLDTEGRTFVFGGEGKGRLGSLRGLLADTWSFAKWCTQGLTLSNSPSQCFGTVGQTCGFGCNDGYNAVGIRRCRGDQAFRGGSCVPSECPAVQLTLGQIIVSGCARNGVMGTDRCVLGCADGYQPVGASDGLCTADTGASTASYKGHELQCIPATCALPELASPAEPGPGCGPQNTWAVPGDCEAVGDGFVLCNGYCAARHTCSRCFGKDGSDVASLSEATCVAEAQLGASCEPQCAYGYVKSDGSLGVCTPDVGETTASFVGQQIVCTPFAVDRATGAWTYIGGEDNYAESLSFAAKFYQNRTVTSETAWPTPRSAHATAGDRQDVMWLFGGIDVDETTLLNDLWDFDGSAWNWFGGSNPRGYLPNYGKHGTYYPTYSAVRVILAWPGARHHHALWSDASGSAFLFGGFGWGEKPSDVPACQTADISDPDAAVSRAACGSAGACTYTAHDWGQTYAAPLSGWCLNAARQRVKMVILQPAVVGLENCATACSADPACEGFTILVSENSACGLHTSTTHAGTLYYAGNALPIYGSDSGSESVSQCIKRLKDAESCVPTDDGYINDAILYDTSGYLNDLWVYDRIRWNYLGGERSIRSTGSQTAGAEWPGARSKQSTCQHGDAQSEDTFWMFGGEGVALSGSVGMLSGLWSLTDPSSSTRAWHLAGGDSEVDTLGSYGTQGVGVGSNWPGSRSQSALWCDDTAAPDGLVLFGGFGFGASGVAGELSDLWLYQGGVWTHTGGSASTGSTAQYAVQFSVDAGNWPGARHGATSWSDAEGGMWLLGGSGYGSDVAGGSLNDLWTFSTGGWSWVGGVEITDAYGEYRHEPGLASPFNWPGSRSSSSVWVDDTGVPVLFGGHGHTRFGSDIALNDAWKFEAMCVAGLTIPDSAVLCEGAIGKECFYTCNDGHNVTGRHICQADGTFRGGRCEASACPMPPLVPGQRVVSGCQYIDADGNPRGGIMGEEHCELACEDGYRASGNHRATCVADEGEITSSYFGLTHNCMPSTCQPPALGYAQRIVNGCIAGGSMGAGTCHLGCEDGHAATNVHIGVCIADVGAATASYSGQSATCIPALCPRPVLAVGQRIVAGCLDHAPMGAHCRLGCRDGYIESDARPGTCDASSGLPTAAFSAAVTCTPSLCRAPPLTVGQAYGFGCEDNGVLGTSTCELVCEDGYQSSESSIGACLPDSGEETASYQGQSIKCAPSFCSTPELAVGQVIRSGCGMSRTWAPVGDCAFLRPPGSFVSCGGSCVPRRGCGDCTEDASAHSVVAASSKEECEAPVTQSDVAPAQDCTFLGPNGAFVWCGDGCVPRKSCGNALHVAICELGCDDGYTGSQVQLDGFRLNVETGLAGLEITTGVCMGDRDSETASFQGQLQQCRPKPCWWMNWGIDHSPTWCYGNMGDTCDFGCEPGYEPHGERVCGWSNTLHDHCSGHNAGRDCRMAFTGGECVACPLGMYNSGRERTPCVECEAGRFADAFATSACDRCPGPIVDDNIRIHWTLDGSWSVAGSYKCTPWTRCSLLEYATVPGTTTSDRECAALTVCDYTIEWDIRVASDFEDRVCASLTVCTETEYELVPPTTSTDRVCARLDSCTQSEFEAVPPALLPWDPQHGPSPRDCAKIAPEGSFVWCAGACVPQAICGESNRVCMPLSDCGPVAETHYESVPMRVEERMALRRPADPCSLLGADGVLVSHGGSCILGCVEELERIDENRVMMYTTDRICTALTVCDYDSSRMSAHEYELAPASLTSDRQCAPTSVCTELEWERTAVTPTSDRECVTLVVCDYENQFKVSGTPMRVEGKWLTDRVCIDLTVCASADCDSDEPWTELNRDCEWESRSKTSYADRLCSPTTFCDFDNEYESNAPIDIHETLTPTDNRAAGLHTYASDRTCTALTLCDFRFQYESRPKSNTADRVCESLTVCTRDEYEIRAPTETTDRVCKLLTVCTRTEFRSVPETATSDRVCQTATVCELRRENVSSIQTYASAGCAALGPPGSFVLCGNTCVPRAASYGLPGLYCTGCIETASSALYGRHVEVQCASGIGEYEAARLLPSSDRVCVPYTICNRTAQVNRFQPGEYERVAPTLYTDRVCAPLTVCDPLLEYEWRQEAEKEDRVCRTLEVCNSLDNLFPEWETVAPTPISDRECAPVTPCSVRYEWELRAPTNTSDRVCRERTRCAVDVPSCRAPMAPPPPGSSWSTWGERLCEYERVEPTKTSDRICSVATLCGVLEYEAAAPTATSDRICAALTTCRPGEVERSPATATTDRVCAVLDICNTLAEFEMAPPVTSTRVTPYCTCSPPVLNYTAANRLQTGHNNTEQLGLTEWDAAKWRVPHDPCCVGYTSATVVSSTVVAHANVSFAQDVLDYWSADRVCRPLTRCRLAAHLNSPGSYASVAATPTSDRVCSPLTLCEPYTEWEAVPPTPNSDRRCQELTFCDFNAGEIELLEPSLANDRVCLPPQPVSDGSVELSMRLNISFSVARDDVHGFNELLVIELARALGVSPSRIVITRVAAGSIIVEFTVYPPEGDAEGEADAAQAAGTFLGMLEHGGHVFNASSYPLLSKLMVDDAPTFAVLRTGVEGPLLALVVFVAYAYVVCGMLYVVAEVRKMLQGSAISNRYSVEEEEEEVGDEKRSSSSPKSALAKIDEPESENAAEDTTSEKNGNAEGRHPREHNQVHANGGARWLMFDRVLGSLGFLSVLLDFGFVRAVRNEATVLYETAVSFAQATGAESLGADAELAEQLNTMVDGAVVAIIIRGLVVGVVSMLFIRAYRRQLVAAHRQDNMDAWSIQSSITTLRQIEAEEAAARAEAAAAAEAAERAKKERAQLLWGKRGPPKPGEDGEEHRMFAEDLKVLNFRSEQEVEDEMNARAQAAIEGARMRELFSEMDDDGSGSLEMNEVKVLMEKMGQKLNKKKLAKAFAAMDADGSGEVGWEEFSAWYVGLGEQQRAKLRAKEHKAAQKQQKLAKLNDMFGKNWSEEKEAELVALWSEVDADGSGALDPDELRSVMERMGMKLDGKKLSRLMRQIDTDGDGTVDLDEFRAWWKKQSDKARTRLVEQKKEVGTPETEPRGDAIVVAPSGGEHGSTAASAVDGDDAASAEVDGSADASEEAGSKAVGSAEDRGRRRRRRGNSSNGVSRESAEDQSDAESTGASLTVEQAARRLELRSLEAQLATIVSRLELAEGRQLPHALCQLFGLVCPELLLQLFWPPPMSALRALLRSYGSVAAAANIPVLTLQWQYAALRGLRPDVPGGGSNPTTGIRVLLVVALVASLLSVVLRLLPGMPRVCEGGFCKAAHAARSRWCCTKCKPKVIAPARELTPYEKAVLEAQQGKATDGSEHSSAQGSDDERGGSGEEESNQGSPPATPPTGITRAAADAQALENGERNASSGRRGKKVEH